MPLLLNRRRKQLLKSPSVYRATLPYVMLDTEVAELSPLCPPCLAHSLRRHGGRRSLATI